MRRPLVAAAALLALLVAGCAGSPSGASSTPGTTAGGSRAACQSLATITSGLASLSNAGNNITVAQVKTIQSGIGVALNVVDKLVPADSSATLAQLKSANDQLAQTVAGLPAGDTLGQHGPQLQQFKSQVAKAQTATSTLATKLKCTA